MSVPIPSHQSGAPEPQPEGWSALDYAAYGAKVSVWGAAKVVQIGILWPLEIIGTVAGVVEKALYGTEAAAEPGSLAEKEISELSGEPPEVEGASVESKKLAELKEKVRELEEKLALSGPGGSPARGHVLRTGSGSSPSRSAGQQDLNTPAQSPQRTGRRIAFAAADDSEADVAGSASASSSSSSIASSQEVSDKVVEAFVSPLYDNENESEIMQSLGSLLHTKQSGMDLEMLLKAPEPPKLVNLQAGRPVGAGGPPPPPPGAPMPPSPLGSPSRGGGMNSPDAQVMKKFGITQDQLRERRALLKELYDETSKLIAGYRKEMGEVKKTNEAQVKKAHAFEETRLKDFNSLKDYKKDQEVAQAKFATLESYVDAYNALIEKDPAAESDVVLRFEMQTGKGEARVVDLPIKEVVERNLLAGYGDEVARIEDNMRNLITSMNTSKRSIGDKLYAESLKYKSKQLSPDGTPVETEAEIQLAEFLKKEKSLRVAEAKRHEIREQMKLYGVSVASEKKVVEDANPDESALAKEREREKAAQMKKELAEKISGLKPTNVADFTFSQL